LIRTLGELADLMKSKVASARKPGILGSHSTLDRSMAPSWCREAAAFL